MRQNQNPILYEDDSKTKQSPYLEYTMLMYIDYLRDVDTPHHLKKHLSKSYIKSTMSFLGDFVSFLVSKGAKLDTYKLDSINDSIVGKYCVYLETKSGSNYTYNAKIKTMRAFFNYLIDKEDYNLKNGWK